MIEGPDGWMMTPEGGLLHVEHRVGVVADLHLGYEWARGSGGDCLPAHSLAETIEGLGSMIGRAAIDRLIVAGDLVESARPCPRTSADIRRLTDWLGTKGVTLILIRGNHDPQKVGNFPLSLEIGGWTISHGHRPVGGTRSIIGHHHPVLRAGGITAPCFVAGPRLIALPAFTKNAAGLPIGSAGMPRGWMADANRCVASLGGEVLDFGPVPDLVRKIGGMVVA